MLSLAFILPDAAASLSGLLNAAAALAAAPPGDPQPIGTLADLLSLLTNLDTALDTVVTRLDAWVYVFLALTVFLETGVVVLPFLPGDSLLFAVGLVAARGSLNPFLAFSLLSLAAVAGDSAGYWIGHWFRDHVAQGKRLALVRPSHLAKTEVFFRTHGPKAVMLARFVPIVRSLTPFAAGLAAMPYAVFLRFSVVGAALWVGSFVSLGFWLGHFEFVRKNFPYVALGVVLVTILAMINEYLKGRREEPPAPTAALRPTPTDQPGAAVLNDEPTNRP